MLTNTPLVAPCLFLRDGPRSIWTVDIPETLDMDMKESTWTLTVQATGGSLPWAASSLPELARPHSITMKQCRSISELRHQVRLLRHAASNCSV